MDNRPKEESFIYTDIQKTKDVLWESFLGFEESYNNNLMLSKLGRKEDVIEMMTLFKYANAFHNYIIWYIDDFKTDLEKDEDKNFLDNIRTIFAKEEDIDMEEYKIIRRFFGKFMHITGISKVTKLKQDPGNAIENELFG